MRYTLKKTTAFLLVLVMLINICPLSVFAADGDTGVVDPAGLPTSYSVVLNLEEGIPYVPEGYHVIVFNSEGSVFKNSPTRQITESEEWDTLMFGRTLSLHFSEKVKSLVGRYLNTGMKHGKRYASLCPIL